MAWFVKKTVQVMLQLVTLSALVFSRQLPQKEFGADLAHFCAKLGSLPEEAVPVVMLHEITETKETWDGLYQNIPFLSHRRVCIYDARNHGDSPWNNTFNVDVLADDLGNFMHAMKIEKAALVGHGMGGLTAMKFALENPDRVESIFVEDISPVGIPDEASSAVILYVSSLKHSLVKVPGEVDEETARQSIINTVLTDTEGIYNISVDDFPKEFPIHCRDGKWQWKMNFDAFVQAFVDLDKFFGKMEGRYSGKVFFIYGKNSLYEVDKAEAATRKLFPNSEFLGIEGSGHVIHRQHSEFLRQLIKFLH